MLANVWRRGRLAALIGVCTAGVLTAAGVSAGAAMAQPQTPAHVRTSVQAQAKVPWAQVGPGWTLAMYATTTSHGWTLYLAGPNGAKYALRTWPGLTLPGTLVAWSGDKSRALFFNDQTGKVTQLNLMTGKTNSFILTGQTSPQGYTTPHGLNILAVRNYGSSVALERFSLTGKLQKVLVRDTFATGGVYNPNGATLAVNGSKGVRLVSNAGGVIRNLNVPGTDPRVGCAANRWWDSRTILAVCNSATGGPRLWLVPASGAKPTALTPLRTKGFDLGDIAAWRLSSGLYLQSLGACGSLEINKQAANGSVTPVNVPGTPNTKNVILSANGPRLLIYPINACNAGSGLLWYNPGNDAETWLFGYSAHEFLTVVPFNSIADVPGI
jgi:hypothetical protein